MAGWHYVSRIRRADDPCCHARSEELGSMECDVWAQELKIWRVERS